MHVASNLAEIRIILIVRVFMKFTNFVHGRYNLILIAKLQNGSKSAKLIICVAKAAIFPQFFADPESDIHATVPCLMPKKTDKNMNINDNCCADHRNEENL